MSGFDLAADRLTAAVDRALDVAAGNLARGLPVDTAIEVADGRRLVILQDARAVLREFGTSAAPSDPFLVARLAEAERELAALVTEALHLEP